MQEPESRPLPGEAGIPGNVLLFAVWARERRLPGIAQNNFPGFIFQLREPLDREIRRGA